MRRAMSRETQTLFEPISTEAPCGVDLEDSQTLASLDAFRLFGQLVPREADKQPDWADLKAKSVDALAESKDLRVLAHLAAAVIRTDGVPTFFEVLSTAAQWLESFWDGVHPRVNEDALLRRNALNCLADRIAVIDALRRAPLVMVPQLGAVSVRDLEIASGQAIGPEGEDRRPNQALTKAAFAASPIETLIGLMDGCGNALGALRRIETAMVSHAGVEAAPAFEPLEKFLRRAQEMLANQIKAHPDKARAGGASVAGNGEDKGGASHSLGPVGSIQSREDAVRALDAIATFFRQSEPSSPVPLIVERAKRLVSKDFLEVLADVAPDALAQAKGAAGIHDS
jgi:type VI secretion system protein ImpA